jgi:hypothetical protein
MTPTLRGWHIQRGLLMPVEVFTTNKRDKRKQFEETENKLCWDILLLRERGIVAVDSLHVGRTAVFCLDTHHILMDSGEDESERDGNNKDSKGCSYTRGWNGRGVKDWFEGVEEQGDYWCFAWGWIAGRPPYAKAEQSDVQYKITMFHAGYYYLLLLLLHCLYYCHH